MQGEYIQGYLISTGDHPSTGPIRPDRPTDPGYGIPEGPIDPDFGIPLPPVIDNSLPPQIDNGLPPTYPVYPSHGLPIGPGHLPSPPVTTWPPPQPIFPGGVPIYPDNTLPMPPGAVWPPVPGIKGKVLCFVWIVGVGYRWTVLDPSLKPDIGLPGDQPGIDNTLPTSPQGPPAVPKR
jgi:hypothetical protein